MKPLIYFLSLLIIWLLLTCSFDLQPLIAGIVFSALLASVMAKIYPTASGHIFNPLRWFWFIVYLVYFTYHCIMANIDVAYRVLHPDVPIHPGIVKVTTGLKTDIAKTFLANSITLTPGTLTVDIDGPDLYIHWINVTTQDPDEQNNIIVRRFERVLRRIFE